MSDPSWKCALVAAAFTVASLPAMAQSRLASDFEIAQMERQLERSRDFSAQISGRLNIGDARSQRSEIDLARTQYRDALALAQEERSKSRGDGQLTRYTTATSYASLANAKLGRRGEAFTLAEEAVRYESGSAKTWNLYASAMSVLGLPAKAAGAARNAVAIATTDLAADASVANRLDLAVYQYALASALAESGDRDTAAATLKAIAAALDGAHFAELRKEVARQESFEIYSSARGDASTWLSLVNRANLRLAALLERSGDAGAARQRYQRVLASRTDDATALAALARLSAGAQERDAYFASAFDANPFSMTLIREYQRAIAANPPASVDDSTTGGRMRRALIEMLTDRRAARRTLEELGRTFPGNRSISTLLVEAQDAAVPLPFLAPGVTASEASSEQLETLLDLLVTGRMTAPQRSALDAVTLTSTISFAAMDATQDASTSFTGGTIGRVRFRFASSTAFRGAFAPSTPLRLTYRVLGATKVDGKDALLLEPLRLEATR